QKCAIETDDALTRHLRATRGVACRKRDQMRPGKTEPKHVLKRDEARGFALRHGRKRKSGWGTGKTVTRQMDVGKGGEFRVQHRVRGGIPRQKGVRASTACAKQ